MTGKRKNLDSVEQRSLFSKMQLKFNNVFSRLSVIEKCISKLEMTVYSNSEDHSLEVETLFERVVELSERIGGEAKENKFTTIHLKAPRVLLERIPVKKKEIDMAKFYVQMPKAYSNISDKPCSTFLVSGTFEEQKQLEKSNNSCQERSSKQIDNYDNQEPSSESSGLVLINKKSPEKALARVRRHPTKSNISEKSRARNDYPPVFGARRKPRKTNCGKCNGCISEDCGKCRFCKDKKKFGGKNKIKQKCKERECRGYKKLSTPRPKESSNEISQNADSVILGCNNTTSLHIGTRAIRLRCKECIACIREDCRACAACKDRLKYGGQGFLKQNCEKRKCQNPKLPLSSTCHICSLNGSKSYATNSYDKNSPSDLMECTKCYECCHIECARKSTGCGIINNKICNSWLCAKCQNTN